MKKLLVTVLVLLLVGCVTDVKNEPAIVVLKTDPYYEAKQAILVQAKAPNSVIFEDILYNAKLQATCGYMSDEAHADGSEQFIYTSENKMLTLKSAYREEQYDLFQSSWEICTHS